MDTHKLPYAEDINYWKSGQSAPDTWIEKAKKEIQSIGGKIEASAFGESNGTAAFMLSFVLNEDAYKIVFPVLPCRIRTSGNEKAAKTQAATMLYHDVKAKAVLAKVMGKRAAFFSYLLLPDGRTAAEVATPELTNAIPSFLRSSQYPALPAPTVTVE